MMAAAVLAFVWLVFFSNPIGSVSIPATNLGNFLQTADIKEITTTERETVTTITGNYVSEEGGTIYFTATFETSNTFIKEEVDAALSGRLINENDPNQGFYYAQIWNTNNAFETTWFDAWGPTIFVVGGSALVFLFIFSRMNSSVNNTNNKALEFNRSRARREDNSKVKFADVAGAEEEKAELVELVEYLKTPAKFTRLGAKLPRGVLLVGPPGTGKTLLAKAVAGEAGVPFFSISGSDFVEMFVGVGAGRVRDMFRQAKRNAPCLIFIDEIDAVGRQRGAGMGGGNDEREQTLNQLLVELDGFADNSGIIVIAATNRDDVLDPALLRAGRFDRQITVNLPDRKGRAAIFAVHSRNKKIDPTVDFDNISKRTVGFSGADIANIMNEAAILAVRSNRETVTIKDIDEAIDRRIAGPAKSSKGMSEHEREVVAYHEAGHAVIGLNLKFSDKVQKITIVPRGRTGGHVMMTPEEDRFLMTKNQLEARIIGYLGGRTSEEIFFGDVSTGAQNDIEVATRIARMMVTEYGMSSLGPIQYESNTGSVFLGRDYNSTQKNFSTQVAFEIDKEVRKIIDNAHEEARKLLTEKKQDVVLIAKTLLEKETITAEEIQGILNNKPVNEDVKKPRKKKEDKDA
jgi:cell division protease FtsH